MISGYIEWWPEYKFPLIDWRACLVRSISPGTSCRSTSYWYCLSSFKTVVVVVVEVVVVVVFSCLEQKLIFRTCNYEDTLSLFKDLLLQNSSKKLVSPEWQSLKNWVWILNVDNYFESFELVYSLTSSYSLFPCMGRVLVWSAGILRLIIGVGILSVNILTSSGPLEISKKDF